MQIDTAVKFMIASVKFHFGLLWLSVKSECDAYLYNLSSREGHDKYHVAAPDPKGLVSLELATKRNNYDQKYRILSGPSKEI